jgi:hypothetical protein
MVQVNWFLVHSFSLIACGLRGFSHLTLSFPFRVNPFRVNPSPFYVEDPANGGGEGPRGRGIHTCNKLPPKPE